MQGIVLRHHDWIANHALRRPEAEAAIDLGTGERLTYRAFHERIDAIAAWLGDDFAIGTGDRVTVLAQACTDIFAIQFACFRLGAIFVPLNIRLAAPELAAIMANCTPALLLHDAAFAALAAQLVPDGSATRLVPMDLGSAFALAAASDRRPARRAEMALHDVACILYTSGTTGLPKGVMITYGMNLFNAVNFTGLGRDLQPNGEFIVLPLFHTGGLNCYSNPVFHAGGTVVVDAGLRPRRGAAGCSATRSSASPTSSACPRTTSSCASTRTSPTTDLSRLAHAGVGGAPAPLSVIEAWRSGG